MDILVTAIAFCYYALAANLPELNIAILTNKYTSAINTHMMAIGILSLKCNPNYSGIIFSPRTLPIPIHAILLPIHGAFPLTTWFTVPLIGIWRWELITVLVMDSQAEYLVALYTV